MNLFEVKVKRETTLYLQYLKIGVVLLYTFYLLLIGSNIKGVWLGISLLAFETLAVIYSLSKSFRIDLIASISLIVDLLICFIIISLDFVVYSSTYFWVLILVMVGTYLRGLRFTLVIMFMSTSFFIGNYLYCLHYATEKLSLSNAQLYFSRFILDLAASFIFVLLSSVLFERVQKRYFMILQRQQHELEMSARLSALGEMASGIAHEINNPLTIISGYCEIIRKKSENDQVLKISDKIYEAVSRISSIIKNMRILLGDPSHLQKEEIFISELITPSIEGIKQKAVEQEVEIRIEIQEDFRVQVNRVQASQVLINLLNNSIDAISNKEDKWILLKAEKSMAKIEVFVIDSGEPIPAKIHGKLFHPFFTTKEVGKGTGMGLSISKAIAEAMGGNLEYLQDQEQTTFVFELPLA